ncbi:MAG: hypothetical protein HYU63_08925 [Armatimonadetes bacterium]|nr:hypothetical protein [Armatimonadota bacterium]
MPIDNNKHIGPGLPLPGWEKHPEAEIKGIGIIYPDPHINKIIEKIKTQFKDKNEALKAQNDFRANLAAFESNRISDTQFINSVPKIIKEDVERYSQAYKKLGKAKQIIYGSEKLNLDKALEIKKELPEEYQSDLDTLIKEKMELQQRIQA